MTTEAQIEANRINAQKSTGPRTPEGKAKAAQNALKHGLFTRETVIRGEDQQEFEEYRENLLNQLIPGTPLEETLARWKEEDWEAKKRRLFRSCPPPEVGSSVQDVVRGRTMCPEARPAMNTPVSGGAIVQNEPNWHGSNAQNEPNWRRREQPPRRLLPPLAPAQVRLQPAQRAD